MKNRLLPLVIKYFGEGGLRPVACARGQLPHWHRQGGQGAQPPKWPGKRERKGVFLPDVQHVYLYSLFN